jgi:15,16-dihydrobiliverdin:ferredoxin oxidoreductase
MKSFSVVVVAVVATLVGVSVNAFHSSFVPRKSSTFALSSSRSQAAFLRMDMELDRFSLTAQRDLEKRLQRGLSLSLEEAEASHGMPWKSSICPKVAPDSELLYMPFWEWQMSFMKENLTNLQVMSCTNSENTDFTYNENTKKSARIVNLCASSNEYRKIRMTYYDAGDNTQVFNSVWYPDPKYDLPVLGIDLLAFNRKKYLAIVDFQPLTDDQPSTFEPLLEPIKNQYESLKGRMSSKFYDETQFFSQQMLFARFEDEGVVQRDLFPAFQSYVKTHVDMLQSTTPEPHKAASVLERQQAYDTYSAERDPATGLFISMFGQEWATDFVHDFLFSLSVRPTGAAKPPAIPSFGGPPVGAPVRPTGLQPALAQVR